MEATAHEPLNAETIQGWKYFRRLTPLLARLHDAGCARDGAGSSTSRRMFGSRNRRGRLLILCHIGPPLHTALPAPMLHRREIVVILGDGKCEQQPHRLILSAGSIVQRLPDKRMESPRDRLRLLPLRTDAQGPRAVRRSAVEMPELQTRAGRTDSWRHCLLRAAAARSTAPRAVWPGVGLDGGITLSLPGQQPARRHGRPEAGAGASESPAGGAASRSIFPKLLSAATPTFAASVPMQRAPTADCLVNFRGGRNGPLIMVQFTLLDGGLARDRTSRRLASQPSESRLPPGRFRPRRLVIRRFHPPRCRYGG